MKYLLKLLIAATVFTGCAKTLPPPQGNALLPEIDIVQVKDNSDEALKTSQEAKLDVEALNAKVVELDNQISILSDDLSSVSVAKIEEIENRVALLYEEVKLLQKAIEGGALRGKLENGKKRKTLATFKPAKPKNAAEKEIDNTKASIKRGDYESYQRALKLYNKKDYNKAIEEFKKLLESSPKGTYADNCTYWIGECYYMINDFAQAIGWYKKVFNYTDTEKSDDAQFKLAKSYTRMGENSQAVYEYENLLSMYPASEYVARAKKDLDKLKKK